jgi:hypothetical protein
MSCDGLTLGKINFWIHSKSSFTSPATCFECYNRTGKEMGKRRFQRWLGTLKTQAIFCPSTPSCQIAKCMFIFEQSYAFITKWTHGGWGVEGNALFQDSLYRRTTGLGPIVRKLYLTYHEYFYFYFIPT